MKTELPLKTLLSAQRIRDRILELGAQITADYGHDELTVVAVLKGSVLFFADLIRAIDRPVMVDFLEVSSYGDETKSSGVIRITKDLTHSVTGQHVLIVEDIIDTGLTMRYLLENLRTRRPASLRICTLLEKLPRPASTADLVIDYSGFIIDDKFVIGYGLDHKGYCRNIPEICYLEVP
ncbi:MAG: hypoxanthine phosphoribosyltransferase [Deltaproteobacteria bacterium RIFOXYA12_FULL_61_11]|nr:MAG: hypoxanthine phosphoribosyltransferase [Deltaproteobacteria bacterium RIFOXYA12_FULL_61_11]